MSLEGRVAIVTGGNRGVGRGIALGLAQDGADIALNYRKDEDSARRTLEDVRALGRRAELYQASVDDFDACKAMVDKAAADFGHLDILINNAGIASRGNSVADTDPAEMERVVRVHAFGSFYMSHLVAPLLRERERGDIIMISSAGTRRWMANGSPYNMGKAAIEALAYGLYKEELEYGTRVNIVAPGVVETDMGRRLVKARGIDNIRDMDADMPFGHVCTPEDVANVVRYLVSEQNSYLTGERIYVDGGVFMGG